MKKVLILLYALLLISCNKDREIVFKFWYPEDVPLNYDDCGNGNESSKVTLVRVIVSGGVRSSVYQINKTIVELDSNSISHWYDHQALNIKEGRKIQIQTYLPARNTLIGGYHLLIPNVAATVDGTQYLIQEYDTIFPKNDCVFNIGWTVP